MLAISRNSSFAGVLLIGVVTIKLLSLIVPHPNPIARLGHSVKKKFEHIEYMIFCKLPINPILR